MRRRANRQKYPAKNNIRKVLKYSNKYLGVVLRNEYSPAAVANNATLAACRSEGVGNTLEERAERSAIAEIERRR